MDREAPPTPLRCSRCGRTIERGRDACYLVDIRVVSDPSPPVYSEADLEADTEQAIRDLLARLGRLSPRQLADEVYCRRLHCLCAGCYPAWVDDPFGLSGRSST